MAFDGDGGALTGVAEMLHQKRASEADKRLVVVFEMQAVQNKEESAKQGRAVYDEKPYIRIIIPGDRDMPIHQPVWDEPSNPNSHTARFPAQWKEFKEGRKQAAIGTPLEQWPPLSRTQVLELKHFEIRTVEQLADLDDAIGSKFMGLQSLKQLAKDYLAKAKDGAAVTKLRSELDDLQEWKKTMERQLREKDELIAKLQKKAEK